MKKLLFVALGLSMAGCCLWTDGDGRASAVSPDGRNEIRLWTSPLAYEVVRDGVTVVAKTEIGLKVDGKCLVPGAKCLVRKEVKSGTVETPVYKKAKVDLSGNETFVDFGDWGVRLAARNDGVAYRFETQMSGRIRVNGERAALTIPQTDERCALNYGSAYGREETIPVFCRAGEIETGRDPERKFVYLPFVYVAGGKHVAVTESDVFDYPVWNLTRDAARRDVVAFDSEYAGWPKGTYHAANGKGWGDFVELPSGGRWIKVREHADYLVETEGSRTFPWRVFVLADAPCGFCSSDIVYALARDRGLSETGAFSWVKPGKVAWDWWSAFDNQGGAGCNTATYRRFIDFAAKNGIEYVILDEGWSERLDIWKFHPEVDVPHLIDYANKKGVGIILWMAWAQVCGEEEKVARHFSQLGAKGFKVDFMDRGDADCERFLWRFADACARNRMVVDYHGAHRPTGMSRAYPNVLNYEGVRGLENTKWFRNTYDFADNDIKQFFLRMTAGPMDYTPGAMDNYPLGRYAGTSVNPGSVGTRCRQMAMMALYEAPLQMLCDAPSKYEKNMECFSFMAATPVVWDETVGLGGCPNRFAAVARKAKDGAWYAAAINSKEAKTFVLDTSFLGVGEWRAEIFRDAADANEAPTHYVHETDRTVRAGERLSFPMASGGGFVVRFSK